MEAVAAPSRPLAPPPEGAAPAAPGRAAAAAPARRPAPARRRRAAAAAQARAVAAAGGADPRRRDAAAAQFAKDVAAGADPDAAAAASLGASAPGGLTDAQAPYAGKLKAALEARAEELRREREARSAGFRAGKAAYARGRYPEAVAFLESALNQEGPFTQLGGEMQLWLALAYEACGREADCIAAYKALEGSHPSPAIRRQAADLRYIAEAPKLELTADDRVAIPVVDLDPNRGRGGGARPRPPPTARGGGGRVKKSWQDEFLDSYRPPRVLRNRYVAVAAAVVALGAAVWSSTVVAR